MKTSTDLKTLFVKVLLMNPFLKFTVGQFPAKKFAGNCPMKVLERFLRKPFPEGFLKPSETSLSVSVFFLFLPFSALQALHIKSSTRPAVPGGGDTKAAHGVKHSSEAHAGALTGNTKSVPCPPSRRASNRRRAWRFAVQSASGTVPCCHATRVNGWISVT